MDIVEFALAIFCLAFIALIAATSATQHTNDKWQKECVARGVASYEVENDKGKTKFKWNEE